MNQYFNAGQGLKKMFIANVGIIIATVCAGIGAAGAVVAAAGLSVSLAGVFVGLAGLAAIALLVFAIISLVGLYGAGKDIEGCKTAFTITIIAFGVSILGNMFKSSGTLKLLFDLAGYALSFLQTYYVCASVSEVMSSIGAQDIANTGNTVWKVYLACEIIMAVIAILAKIPAMAALALLGSVAGTVVSLVGLILYMIFLQKSSKALGA